MNLLEPIALLAITQIGSAIAVVAIIKTDIIWLKQVVSELKERVREVEKSV
ncbi:hypothetical protein [Vibrio mediterranei]|jgi:hypothetical protein|uniref:hypothetical protein n=1 Tax=Vibrio mediterranei TaxID=689 RepID=UPI0015E6FD09|nr:hypothetical protein [Vibrio mediterranei]MCG9656781.1 hypothetical protein [Vibrio mediterranei]